MRLARRTGPTVAYALEESSQRTKITSEAPATGARALDDKKMRLTREDKPSEFAYEESNLIDETGLSECRNRTSTVIPRPKPTGEKDLRLGCGAAAVPSRVDDSATQDEQSSPGILAEISASIANTVQESNGATESIDSSHNSGIDIITMRPDLTMYRLVALRSVK